MVLVSSNGVTGVITVVSVVVVIAVVFVVVVIDDGGIIAVFTPFSTPVPVPAAIVVVVVNVVVSIVVGSAGLAAIGVGFELMGGFAKTGFMGGFGGVGSVCAFVTTGFGVVFGRGFGGTLFCSFTELELAMVLVFTESLTLSSLESISVNDCIEPERLEGNEAKFS